MRIKTLRYGNIFKLAFCLHFSGPEIPKHPHLPGKMGSNRRCVKFQKNCWKDKNACWSLSNWGLERKKNPLSMFHKYQENIYITITHLCFSIFLIILSFPLLFLLEFHHFKWSSSFPVLHSFLCEQHWTSHWAKCVTQCSEPLDYTNTLWADCADALIRVYEYKKHGSREYTELI